LRNVKSIKRNLNNSQLNINNMKKFLFTIIACIYAMAMQAQNDHLKFKGVPIDGTLQEYVQKMRAAGFTSTAQQDGIAILKGDFAGFKGCTIGVATLDGKDLVSKITVFFPENTKWSALYGTYEHLKSLLTEKYGHPANSVEEFQGYTPDDDGGKLHAVKVDRCNYVTEFSPKEGNIQLSMSHDEMLDCYVVLSYLDKVNSDIIRQKALDDL